MKHRTPSPKVNSKVDSAVTPHIYPDLAETVSLLNRQRKTLRRLFREFEIPANPVNRKDKRAIASSIHRTMRQHTRLERDVLYPLISQIAQDHHTLNRNIVETMTLDYLASLIETLDMNNSLYDATIDVLGEYALRHFQEQADGLFDNLIDSQDMRREQPYPQRSSTTGTNPALSA